MMVHYPKLYNMTHLPLNAFTASKGSNNCISLNCNCQLKSAPGLNSHQWERFATFFTSVLENLFYV